MSVAQRAGGGALTIQGRTTFSSSRARKEYRIKKVSAEARPNTVQLGLHWCSLVGCLVLDG